jgi:hypothetical protein
LPCNTVLHFGNDGAYYKKFVGLPIIFLRVVTFMHPVVSPAAIWISLPQNVWAGKNTHAADTALKD